MDAWEERFRGQMNFVIEILKGGKTARVRLFCDTEAQAKAIHERFGGSIRKVLASEWSKPRAPQIRPLKIRDTLLVTPETNAKNLKSLQKSYPKRQIISIPAEMAFGTGDHATTSTCLRLIADLARKRAAGWSLADLGTGTGLLAIAAKKLGAESCYACDFDPYAVKATMENISRNDVVGIEVAEQDVLKWKPCKQYDVVVANLFSTILIQVFPNICKLLRPGGDVIISGILASQAWDVFVAAAENGLGFPTVIRKGKWVTARGGWMNDIAAAETQA